MKLVRSMAVGISQRVARWAAPGCKEWAEGLARESEFIASDWRALAWALGSTRVLLERRFAVESGAKKRWPTFTDCISWLLQNAGVFWMGAVAFSSATQATHATSWQVRLGSIVIALGWSSCVIGSVQRTIRERNAPPLSDAAARAAHSRARLQQQLAHSRTFRRWLPALLGAAMCGGYVLAQPKWLNGWAMFFALLTIWVLRQGSPTRLHAQIARIDQDIAELEASRMRALTANSAPAEFIRTQSFENLVRRRRQFRRRVVR